jgi:endoglucanase
VADIVGFIKSLGMNVVRLTFAIEMVDDIYDESPDQTLQATLVKALGEQNGTTVLSQILEHNPDFTADMTRLEVRQYLNAFLRAHPI